MLHLHTWLIDRWFTGADRGSRLIIPRATEPSNVHFKQNRKQNNNLYAFQTYDRSIISGWVMVVTLPIDAWSPSTISNRTRVAS